MLISWAAKRQLFYFFIIILFFAAILFWAYLKSTVPTCFDGKKNQREQGLDCGGPCSQKCLGEIQDLVVLWAKPLEAGVNEYDAIAMVENRNLRLSAQSVKYQFKFYDEQNILIASKEGDISVNSGQKFPIFIHGVDVGRRVPVRAFLEIQKKVEWKVDNGNIPGIVVSRKEYKESPRPGLSALVENKSLLVIKDVLATAIIYDQNNEVVAASATKIKEIGESSGAEIFFTWPKAFGRDHSRDEIFLSVQSISGL